MIFFNFKEKCHLYIFYFIFECISLGDFAAGPRDLFEISSKSKCNSLKKKTKS